mmetsp:Transcript_15577/g.37284  ORF Transcript_15577/g.37284 Transcript_15577/m.37284 type:complete len:227 (+) Transcript_15577:635-1315(+)
MLTWSPTERCWIRPIPSCWMPPVSIPRATIAALPLLMPRLTSCMVIRSVFTLLRRVSSSRRLSSTAERPTRGQMLLISSSTTFAPTSCAVVSPSSRLEVESFLILPVWRPACTVVAFHLSVCPPRFLPLSMPVWESRMESITAVVSRTKLTRTVLGPSMRRVPVFSTRPSLPRRIGAMLPMDLARSSSLPWFGRRICLSFSRLMALPLWNLVSRRMILPRLESVTV